jgi:hypothetical protein
MASREAIETISDSTDKILIDMWMDLNPTVYYRNGKPYGAIAKMRDEDGIVWISSMTVGNGKFTKNMLRDIIRVYNTTSIGVLFAKDSDTQDVIARHLEGYAFMFSETDTHVVAIHIKE